MTFNTNAPNSSQSPGIFPAQNNQNNARLKTIINADHVFNDTTQSTDGVHRQCTMIARAKPVGLPVGSNSILYTWLDSLSKAQLRFYNGTTDYQITPFNVIAAVNFDGTGATNANMTIRSQFNVSTVLKTATGRYRINFTTSLPNTNYIVLLTGMRDDADSVTGCVTGDATYGNSVKVNRLLTSFFGSSTTERNVVMGNLIIFGVS